jgi:hypothetical protein
MSNTTKGAYPIVAGVMKAICLVDFIVVSLILSAQLVSLGGAESTQWIYLAHKALVIMNGILSIWKGWKVDGNTFFAVHHAITHVYFYMTTTDPNSVTFRYILTMLLYLAMRNFKRYVDEGLYTKQQWTKAYPAYSYLQIMTALLLTHAEGREHRWIDLVGCFALMDSTYSCRQADLGTKLLAGLPVYFPDSWLSSLKMHKILSLIDGVSIWVIALMPFYGSRSVEADSFKGLVAFFVVETYVKQLSIFKKFERPHVYQFARKNSYPSAHMVVSIVSTYFLPGWMQIAFVLLVAAYRVSSRSHTIDDVSAGMTFGLMFNVAWCMATKMWK